MHLTEQEAESRRCPETALAEFCHGPRCMAWRWANPASPGKWDRVVPHPDDVGNYRRAGYESDPDHINGMRKKISDDHPARGYCGKAGRP